MAKNRQTYIQDIFTGKVKTPAEVSKNPEAVLRILTAAEIKSESWFSESAWYGYVLGKEMWSLTAEEKNGDAFTAPVAVQHLVLAGLCNERTDSHLEYPNVYKAEKLAGVNLLYDASEARALWRGYGQNCGAVEQESGRMNNDLVSREAVEQIFSKMWFTVRQNQNLTNEEVKQIITKGRMELNRLPSSKAEAEKGLRDLAAEDVVPAAKGKWKRISPPDNDGNAIYRCSKCQHQDIHAIGCEVPYCWYCGERMEGEQDAL